jgi:protein phosphatase
MDLKAGFVCDRGLNPKRPVNQDRFLAVAERGLFAVFDGVGGQRAGEVASQTAAETIEEALAHTTAESSVELISRAIKFANRDIFEMAESDPAYKTMATTVALVHIEGNRATIAHVGDSRVYKLEDGRFSCETVDHTDLNDDIRAGIITKERAAAYSDRNVINRALGVDSEVDVEVKSVRISDGARFLLCSDGIYRHMPDEEIARVLAEFKDPQRAADELKRIVHQRGAEDNLTAVVVQVGRARQTPLMAIEGASLYAQGKPADAKAAAGRGGSGARGGRIQVEIGNQQAGAAVSREPSRAFDDQAARGREAAGPQPSYGTRPGAGPSSSRLLQWGLLTVVLVAAAFYAGLRASDFFAGPSSGDASDPLAAGRDGFDRGNYQSALASFSELLRDEPANVRARHWLARAQLETGEYALAAQNFDEVIRAEPLLYDGYIQAAAAYEAMGDKAKAAERMAEYGKARVASRPESANSNSSPR